MDEKRKDELFTIHFVEQLTASVRDYAEVLVKLTAELERRGYSKLKSFILTIRMAPTLWQHMFETETIDFDEEC